MTRRSGSSKYASCRTVRKPFVNRSSPNSPRSVQQRSNRFSLVVLQVPSKAWIMLRDTTPSTASEGLFFV